MILFARHIGQGHPPHRALAQRKLWNVHTLYSGMLGRIVPKGHPEASCGKCQSTPQPCHDDSIPSEEGAHAC